MNFNTDWDIDKYRSEFDAEDHWSLKRSFIVAHKDKYPEEKLICLAQVFYNVEFLGCRYPKKTMKIVEELSKDIAASHREEKKNKLQRTFVSASDAAGAKIKGVKRKFEDTGNLNTNEKLKDSVKDVTPTGKSFPENERLNSKDFQTFKKMKSTKGPLGPMYLMATNNQATANNLDRTAQTWKIPIKNEVVFENGVWRCTFTLGNVSAVAEAPLKPKAKLAASQFLMWKLQQHYYTIKLSTFSKKEIDNREADVEKTDILKAASKNAELSVDNVGMKMLKMMGWSGGGLGKNAQGIEKPVEASGVISRSGLGFGSNFDPKKINSVLTEFKNRTDGGNELVFAKDFTNEERSLIHLAARRMGLKSASIGKNNDRQLIVTKNVLTAKHDPWGFIKMFFLAKEKFFDGCELIPPISDELEKLEDVKYIDN